MKCKYIILYFTINTEMVYWISNWMYLLMSLWSAIKDMVSAKCLLLFKTSVPC